MKKPKCFYLYNDNISLIDRLTNEQAGEVFKAIYHFADTGEKESCDDLVVETVIDVITKHIERDYEAYNRKCEKMRENILKRYNKKEDSTIVYKSSQEKEEEEEKEEKKKKKKDEDKDKEKKEEKENKKEKEEDDFSSLSDSLSSDIDYDSVMYSFNRICISLNTVDEMTGSRKRAVDNAAEILGDISFEELFCRVENSGFLSGKNGKWYGCNFDWILKPENLKKILSGAYDDPAPKPVQEEEYKPYRNPHAPKKTSYDINELKKINTLDFMDEPGWQEKAFGHHGDKPTTGWDDLF